MSCHVMSCHVMSCHVRTCHVMSCHVMLCHVVSCCVMSCHILSCHVMSCHVISCHVMSCHVMSLLALLGSVWSSFWLPLGSPGALFGSLWSALAPFGSPGAPLGLLPGSPLENHENLEVLYWKTGLKSHACALDCHCWKSPLESPDPPGSAEMGT